MGVGRSQQQAAAWERRRLLEEHHARLGAVGEDVVVEGLVDGQRVLLGVHLPAVLPALQVDVVARVRRGVPVTTCRARCTDATQRRCGSDRVAHRASGSPSQSVIPSGNTLGIGHQSTCSGARAVSARGGRQPAGPALAAHHASVVAEVAAVLVGPPEPFQQRQRDEYEVCRPPWFRVSNAHQSSHCE